MAIDPKIHGVAAHEPGAVHLPANIDLQHRINIGEEEILGVLVAGRNLGIKCSEDAELSIQRLGLIYVLSVFAGPEKTLAFLVHNARGVNLMVAEDLLFFFGKVFAYHRDHADLRKETCREGKISGCSSQNAVHPAVGSLDGVKSDRANYQE